MKTIQAGEFKAKCLQLMDEVDEKHISFIITKHGKPVAKLVPIEAIAKSSFGCLKNTASIQGNIIAPIDEQWSANQ
ncbi:MAG TPA: type II toxin-antitoxin system Phd/YefM family antitoxin [Gammaproteobacteria bacterium]|nr:type II toxin-antitoxin system Phd/YefM family antitoxin [Gammaproteobacteria bacterium]